MDPYNDKYFTADILDIGLSVVEASSLLATCVLACMVCSCNASSVTSQVVSGMWLVAHTAYTTIAIHRTRHSTLTSTGLDSLYSSLKRVLIRIDKILKRNRNSFLQLGPL